MPSRVLRRVNTMVYTMEFVRWILRNDIIFFFIKSGGPYKSGGFWWSAGFYEVKIKNAL
jgi:hypothetical protein